MPTDDNTNLYSGDNVRDYLLGLDDLQQPRVIDMSIIKPNEWNSAILMIARLILIIPGTYADHPEMGIDIKGRYRFAFEDELHQLSTELDEQIHTYLPDFNLVSVYAYHKEKNLVNYIVIDIQIDQVTYRILYNVDENILVGLEDV
jgi:hypothetical protein